MSDLHYLSDLSDLSDISDLPDLPGLSEVRKVCTCSQFAVVAWLVGGDCYKP